MDVSIIIVNYKTSGLLAQAIDSVLGKTEGIAYEIIVVDNHSQDDSERVVHERYGDRVTYLPLAENVGFGRANNEGLRIARGRNILFLNPDTILVNNAVRILSDYLDSHPDAGAAGGNLYTADMLPNASFGRTLPGLFDETDRALCRMLSRIRFGRNILFNHKDRPIDVGYICGADLMIPRRILDRTNSFDPDFFMYYEETELSWRIRNQGYRIVNIPQARIVHLEGKSFSQSLDRELRMFISRRIYYRKTHSALYGMLADANYTFFTFMGLAVGCLPGMKALRTKTSQRLRVLRDARRATRLQANRKQIQA